MICIGPTDGGRASQWSTHGRPLDRAAYRSCSANQQDASYTLYTTLINQINVIVNIGAKERHRLATRIIR